MKISEMIRNLQFFMEDYGDFDCWYATDDEGNAHHKVYFSPSFRYVDSDGEVYCDKEEAEICGADIEDITPICIIN